MISEQHWIVAAIMITIGAILLAFVIAFIDVRYLLRLAYPQSAETQLPTNVHELGTLEPEVREAQPLDQTRDVA